MFATASLKLHMFQLVDYLVVIELMPKLRSFYRKHHSIENAVLRVVRYIDRNGQPATSLLYWTWVQPLIMSMMSYCQGCKEVITISRRSLQKVQGQRTAQGRSWRGRDCFHRRPCGTSPPIRRPCVTAVCREVNHDTQGHLQNTQT